jgi:hypothetical protein
MQRRNLIVTHDGNHRLSAPLPSLVRAASVIASLLEKEATRGERVASKAVLSNVVTRNPWLARHDEQGGMSKSASRFARTKLIRIALASSRFHFNRKRAGAMRPRGRGCSFPPQELHSSSRGCF